MAQAGWPKDENGYLKSLPVPDAFKALTGVDASTPIYDAAHPGEFNKMNFLEKAVRPTFDIWKPKVIQTKDHATKLKHNYAYAVQGCDEQYVSCRSVELSL